MKLAVSNIAWPREHDAAVADVLHAHDITGIEVAPTKVWPQPLEATGAQADAYRRWWETRGFRIVAAQALLFGRPELTLFESAEIRERTRDYLGAIIPLCDRLGAEALVFGSPKNRRVGSHPVGQAWEEAKAFFTHLGDVASDTNTTLVMEANPPEYGADFVTRAGLAIDLVTAVDHPHFRLHLDTACMVLAGDSITETFDTGFSLLRHFHASEPGLEPPGTSGRVDHAAFAAELHRRNYSHWVSLEMREPSPFTLEAFAESVRTFRDWYTA